MIQVTGYVKKLPTPSARPSLHSLHCTQKTTKQHIQVALSPFAMSPNGDPYLINPSAKPGLTRFPQARFAPTSAYRTLYISGIACCRPDGTWPGVTTNSDGSHTLDIRAQTAAVLENIDAVVRGATNGKGGVRNMIDAVVYVLDMKTQYEGMNEEWNKVFSTREEAPARATVGVRELPDPRMIVEIKGVAVIEE